MPPSQGNVSTLALAEAQPADKEDLQSSIEIWPQVELPGRIGNFDRGRLGSILRQTPSACLQAEGFFVAWQGVLVIAYSGFGRDILKLKAAIQEEFPALPRENPGSLWPKTSLAALRDGKRLSMEQLRALKAICSDMQHELAWVAVPLHRISATFYGNRCHESLLFARDFELAAPSGTAPDLSNAFHNHGQGNGATSKLGSTPGEELADGHAAIDGMLHGHSQATDCSSNGHLPEEGGVLNGHTTAANGVERPVVPVVATGGVVKGLAMAVVEANEAARVRSVLSEFDEGNLDNYWFHVSRDGSRESHYRAPFMGASLVQFVDSHLPLPLLQRFQQRVEEALPGMYSFFTPESLHITLRALS